MSKIRISVTFLIPGATPPPKKRRQPLESFWPGLFRDHILPSISVSEVSLHLDASRERPTKELYATLGALILQQAFDFTDEETVQQFVFNIQWHYALSVTEESDGAKCICPKTLRPGTPRTAGIKGRAIRFRQWRPIPRKMQAMPLIATFYESINHDR